MKSLHLHHRHKLEFLSPKESHSRRKQTDPFSFLAFLRGGWRGAPLVTSYAIIPPPAPAGKITSAAEFPTRALGTRLFVTGLLPRMRSCDFLFAALLQLGVMRGLQGESLWARWFLGVLALAALLPQVSLEETCKHPGPLTNGIIRANHRVPIIGSVVSFVCIKGFRLIGSNTSKCVHDGINANWSTSLPRCEMVTCEEPVVEHGIKLSGFGRSHAYGINITFECKIGYFMIGSYLIHCEEKNTWVPEVPSCKKIDPHLCGAPLIPSGSVLPLQSEYHLREEIIIQCSPQYYFPDETIEKIVACQGYNSWHPPVQPCVFRTSPDVSIFSIRNGKIIHGKKPSYEPGDNITVECYAGFTLLGPADIRYIGGKQWSPNIPSCSLRELFLLIMRLGIGTQHPQTTARIPAKLTELMSPFFHLPGEQSLDIHNLAGVLFILLITACVLILLFLPAKRVFKKYCSS
ncbi:C4b-binding protein alpha chain-like [Hemicordylus capensis]|uniref:C4b-binding protein alpha chain-like n=1 Tax=Hemicordylus capensis TaxID=884348 RepID=UPI002303D265|nr:C4b-binding protein alpha chain-like [Hemicordylus capensis]